MGDEYLQGMILIAIVQKAIIMQLATRGVVTSGDFYNYEVCPNLTFCRLQHLLSSMRSTAQELCMFCRFPRDRVRTHDQLSKVWTPLSKVWNFLSNLIRSSRTKLTFPSPSKWHRRDWTLFYSRDAPNGMAVFWVTFSGHAECSLNHWSKLLFCEIQYA